MCFCVALLLEVCLDFWRCRYKRNGLLQMLKRNSGVKESPQRWQDNAADGAFDVVFTFEERVFDMVIDGTLICLVFCGSNS
jgi:hypothetical protein